MEEAPTVVTAAHGNLFTSNPFFYQTGISIEDFSSMADEVVKFSSLVSPAPTAI